MPRICLDCRYIQSRPSGIGMVARQLAQLLPQIAPDWSFLFLRNASLPGPLSSALNVSEVPVAMGANTPANMWFLPELVDFKGVDLFHSPSNILPARLSTPSVTTIHDLMWLTQPELCNASAWGKVERLFYQNGMRRALRKSDAIVTVSEATRADIVEYDPAAASKTTAILSGVSRNFQRVDVTHEHLTEIGIGPCDYVLTVGQNAPYKNHINAIRGFADAFSDQSQIRFILVQRRGQGNGELDRLCERLGIAERVHFIDPVDDATLMQLYSGALALLHPSLCEGFGMPLAEAMACGCPVITSNRSAMPEVTGDGAILVDPENTEEIAEALRRVANDPDLRQTLREKGLHRVAQLSWRDCAKAHVEVYRKVLEQR